ncbi:MAG: phosphate acyltransferase PlsX [Candidatus Omnitrophica bacterium]|nr:phosphate acyltransferase PlsX [Candidatus Omnitrophota bacterium]MBD3269691.1 phosphate acyltransferase PlsX [Candidatus Omnitrophota bacterium]
MIDLNLRRPNYGGRVSYKVGIDVSGGDYAPKEIIKGAMLAKQEFGADTVLIGRVEEIEEQLSLYGCSSHDFSLVDAPQNIEMAESPAASIRRKKKSSIVVGTSLLKEKKIDAFVSCGNTGAVVCASTLILGLIEGVERPGIALMLPTKKGISLVVDVGANIDCKPLHLFQYGIMASVYYKLVLNKKDPTVALLNIGEEATKGSEILKNLHQLFYSSSLNFKGNLEARDILSGKYDCIICDGFVGNVALKVVEGSAETVGRFLVETIGRGFWGKLNLFMIKNRLKKFKGLLDYAEYGGAPLLGVEGIVIIGHGRSNHLAVKNAIKVALREVERNLTTEINRRVNEICQDSGVRQMLAP